MSKLNKKDYQLLTDARIFARSLLSIGDYTELEVQLMSEDILENNTEKLTPEFIEDAYPADLDVKCYNIAKFFHEGQTRRGGQPYINHCERVAEIFEGDHVMYGIAILHDTIEDTDMTYDELSRIVPSIIADGVMVMTHQPDEDYYSYIRRVKKSKLVTKIKISDIMDNISDKDCGVKQKDKYLRAIQILAE